ncbi:cold sensitive U2 snRNA suppressor 1 [Trichomonascus vanleenenianus]|uniref:U2 snRNP complex subunit CUS1 n=1 Tax=Trichomonascus vanleenenianus TaxID=2268995 RepID=UPI003EC9A8C5
MAKEKKSKNQLRRERLKAKKLAANQDQERPAETTQPVVNGTTEKVAKDEEVDYENYNYDESQTAQQVDDVADGQPDSLLVRPEFASYKHIFDKFNQVEAEEEIRNAPDEGDMFYSDDEDMEEAEVAEENQLSKKKLRKLNRIPVAELKQLTAHPELVEWHDSNAPDPKFLVELKSLRGVVQVPNNWQMKRDYLSSKSGFKKPLYQLPDYIKATGIMDMRDALKEDEKSLRQKARERVQPKMGTLDLDYGKLRDAFFKFQEKPRLYAYGEVYYEGKQYENDFSMYRPGEENMTLELREALGVPKGSPPPWLLNMQKYGPPPSYPGMRIRGLNAPKPEDGEWGLHAGGWGYPPLDENGKPLYGDVYGLADTGRKNAGLIEMAKWGEMQDDEEEEEEEAEYSEEEEGEEEEEEEEKDEEMEEVQEESTGAGYAEQVSVAAEPEHIELRKRRNDADEEDSHKRHRPDDKERADFEKNLDSLIEGAVREEATHRRRRRFE